MSKLTKAALLKAAQTSLERAVAEWAYRNADVTYFKGDLRAAVESTFADLFTGGCASGMVPELIYTGDCVRFYKRHQAEIASILKELSDSTGESYPAALRDFDKDDPLCLDSPNQNLLAWVGFEESARVLASKLGIEV